MNTQTPLSVVLPVFNGFDLLQPVLAELFRQRVEVAGRLGSTAAVQVVIVDDGSDTPLEPWARQAFPDEEFEVQRVASNKGRGPAVERGIQASRGELVLILDGDIVPGPNMLAEHVAYHRENPEPFKSHLGALEWASDPSPINEILGARTNPRMIDHFGDVHWTLWYMDNWSFKREAFLQTNEHFSEDIERCYWEDLDLSIRLWNKGMRSTSTGRGLGLHLKQRNLESIVQTFTDSVPNLQCLVQRQKESHDALEWLNHSYASFGAWQSARDGLFSIWSKVEAWIESGCSFSDCDPAFRDRICIGLSDSAFGIGIGRGLWETASITVGEPRDTHHLHRLGDFLGGVIGWVSQLEQHSSMERELRDIGESLVRGTGASLKEADDFWGVVERARSRPSNSTSETRFRLGAKEERPIEPLLGSQNTGIELSVIVPTYGRPERIKTLLAKLAEQDLDPARFEVIVIDDGTPEAVRLNGGEYPFSLLLLRQDNGGPGAARNNGLAHARGPLSLILNDDAIPASDLLSGHLAAHAEHGPGRAILGTFPFTAEARKSPFVQTLEDSDLLFNYTGLRHRQVHSWQYFWTCNISLSTDILRSVGGFDAERFREAIVEDVELGYRLDQHGVQVLYRADLICEHDHRLTVDEYFARAKRLGVNLARMYSKHRDPGVIWSNSATPLRKYMLQCQATVEMYKEILGRGLNSLRELDESALDQRLAPDHLEASRVLVRRLSSVPFCRGLLEELEGEDPWERLTSDEPAGKRVSIVVVSHNALDQTRRSLEALRASLPASLSVDLHYVDNGSTDGTPEYLEAQDDVQLIRNSHNVGAPLARNQALMQVEGDYIAVMDNDVIVSPGWLERMIRHADNDARSGCVGCLADRAGQGAQIDYGGSSDVAEVTSFADGLAKENAGKWQHKGLLSSFLLLMRREVLDTLGGFDGSFSPWGFEDDDFTLRSHLAGFRNRLALDVFVRHEAYGGPKAERHNELLHQNWKRFVAKWQFAANPSYGEYSGLSELDQQTWDAEQLHIQPEAQPTASYESPRPVASDHVLAWPNYADSEAVRQLLEDVADELVNCADRQLVLRLDPDLDGAQEQVIAAIEEAYASVFTPEQQLNVHLLDEAHPQAALGLAKSACGFARLTGSDEPRRAWLESSGLIQD